MDNIEGLVLLRCAVTPPATVRFCRLVTFRELTLNFLRRRLKRMNISKKIESLLPAATLVLALAIPAAAANGKPAAAPSAKPAPTAPVPPEKHPQIHEALEALRSSKQH